MVNVILHTAAVGTLCKVGNRDATKITYQFLVKEFLGRIVVLHTAAVGTYCKVGKRRLSQKLLIKKAGNAGKILTL